MALKPTDAGRGALVGSHTKRDMGRKWEFIE